MSLAPLLNTGPAINAHAFAAIGPFALAAVEPTLPNGTKTTLTKSLHRDVTAWQPGLPTRDVMHDCGQRLVTL